ncbi:outer membrane porin BP0840 domain protein [Bordetella bronchiseptica E013]|nr:outer membrane porin BP0840 domain protein [Bordetella bronchiseptica E013]
MTLGYRQDLSARTSLYAYGGYMKGYDPEDPFASDVGRATRFGVGMTQRF